MSSTSPAVPPSRGSRRSGTTLSRPAAVLKRRCHRRTLSHQLVGPRQPQHHSRWGMRQRGSNRGLSAGWAEAVTLRNKSGDDNMGCCTFSMWHSVPLGWGTTAALGLCFKSMSRERSLSLHQRNLNFTRTTLYICTCSHALSPAGALSTSHPPFRPADPLRQPLLRSSPTSCSRSRAYNDRSECLSRDCCRVFGSCFVRILSRALPTTAVQA